MRYAYITFWDKGEPKIRLAVAEYNELKKIWNPRPPATPPDQVWIKGHMIHRKDVRRIYPPPEPEKPLLPPAEKTISKERLEEMKKKISEKFSSKK